MVLVAGATGYVGRRLIPLLGFALGELFDFERLAELAATDGRYDFLFVAVPLKSALRSTELFCAKACGAASSTMAIPMVASQRRAPAQEWARRSRCFCLRNP